MKRTYIQPAIITVRIEQTEIICASADPEQVKVPVGGTTTEYDAPRTRLWCSEEE